MGLVGATGRAAPPLGRPGMLWLCSSPGAQRSACQLPGVSGWSCSNPGEPGAVVRARAGRGHPAGKQGQPGPCSGEGWSLVGVCRNSLCVTPLLYPEVGGVGRRSARPGSCPPPRPCGCLSLARTPEWWPLVGVWSVTRLAQPWHGERAVTCRAAIPRGRLPCRSPGRGRGAGWHAHSRGAGHPCPEGWGGQSPSESPLLPRHAGRVPNRGLSRRKDPVGGLWPHVVGGSWDLETKPVRGP